ncbi:MAG: xylose isomerase [Alphaproteobacteria bacterium]|nr:xylose isomerase [Alphaproteobacteria bacterium]MDE2161794.1 xylose isomerase [Alphaproteobacteria bacterium]MDE2267211.1 xylose isomerase [Alphaproteobacteria bacterium]MDE2501269.1 xylose isomerase [Alphaproteobacteria bacterium]
MSLFSDVAPIRFEGADSTNDLAFKVYDKDRMVMGKRMADWLRLTVCYWHSFNWPGNDIFGAGTLPRPWLGATITQAMAEQKADAAFDFLSRLGVPYFTFHDVDAMASADTLEEHGANLQRIEAVIAEKMAKTKLKLLWGTANLFSHPRYAGGAATNPDPDVFAFAAAQVRFILEATNRLGGENYVLWGGREGYDTLLNTDIKGELDRYGRFLSMVVEHKHKIGFKGTILIEPKPFEPTKHQYDRDVAAVYAFLQRYGLEKEVRVNIEVNHATLAGLDFEHEIAAALAYGIFGSIDMNRGDARNGWDTDQFPNNAQEMTPAMLLFLQAGGFTTGGFNFDAKLRRQSVDPNDLYIAHIAGIDTLARALLAAETIITEKRLAKVQQERYAGWSGAFGKKILAGEYNLASLADHAVKTNLDPKPKSGKQELCESIIASSCKF